MWEFVKDEKLQPLCSPDDCFIHLVLPCHHEFQHHEVGQDDVGGVLGDLVAFFTGLLTGIACEGDGFAPGGIAGFQEPREFFTLTISQRIHWVDHDGADAGLFISGSAFAQYEVNNRDEIT